VILISPAQIDLIATIFNNKEPLTAMLIFMAIVFSGIFGMVKMTSGTAATSTAGTLALATNLAEDNRESNRQYRSLSEQFGDLKAKFGMLEIEFKGVVVKLTASEEEKRELLDKLELVMDQLVTLNKKYDQLSKDKSFTDEENVRLKDEISLLREQVDTLQKQVVLLQSTSPTVLGDVDL
jgi:chromosome segregation ATPase